MLGTDFVDKHGNGPWNIHLQMDRLIKAFTEKDIDKIIKISSELGHYISDLHVPLHTTSNYDGQKTNQRGIHGFWETTIVKYVKKSDWVPLVSVAEKIKDLNSWVWRIVVESHSHLEKIFDIEKRLKEKYFHRRSLFQVNQ